ncbi:hypothetical protein [Streptomyces sp. MZ04]|uniref:hypothetical protein n=1 Tax=Streptomyces sp. MZ04 TaxID=2559236 RepID=UPI00107ED248|nr:hypothetical protein [Streptomyces sp. MZ04]TGB03235.1 hypothetical protein E2651_25760 [Streptomyces sp. MZ04]
MHLYPMLFRFTASGPTPQEAFAAYTAKDIAQPTDPFSPRADLTKVAAVTVVGDRAPLHADEAGCSNASYNAAVGADGAPLSEDDAEWLADRLIEDDAPCVRSGAAGALLLTHPTAEPSWLFFGWSVRAD